jgi:hypothetical protein
VFSYSAFDGQYLNFWELFMTTTIKVGIALLAVAVGFEVRAEPVTIVAQATVPNGASGGAGMKVYTDPQTGAIIPEPAPGSENLVLPPQLQESFSTSSEGLVQVPSPEPGGGVKLDLQGRFQSPLIATFGADGKLRMEHHGHQPEAAGSTDKH